MASDDQENFRPKRGMRERWIGSGPARERLAFGAALAALWALGLWFVLMR